MSIRIKGKKEKRPFLRRAAMSVLAALLALTVQTVWADTYPEYITDIIVVGGSSSEVNTAKSAHSDYTFIETDLNKGCGSSTDDIYIGYKKSSRASTNGGYITNIVITDQSGCPADKTFNGKTYHCAPRYGGDWFTNSVYGDLNSHAGGKDIHVYYTKEEFDDHRVVSGISFTIGKNTYTGGLRWNDNTTGDYADLNAGAGGEYIYMHLTFTTPKVNRPASDPTMRTGLVYNGSAQQLVNYNPASQCTMYYCVDSKSGSFESSTSSVTATTAGTHTVYYYAGANDYGNRYPSSNSSAFSQTVSIAKSPNSGVTVSCPEVIEGTAVNPVTGGTNLSTGAITYKYSTSQSGTYSTTAPTTVGTYWVKATVAGDNNCYEYTTAAVSFRIVSDWALHNSGDTEADAYVIYTAQELDLLSQRVAAGNDYSGKYFCLGSNITYSHTSDWNNTTNTENNYTPIGTESTYFKGNFDGKGYTISGIRVSSTRHYNALFGQISRASVRNIVLSDARIKSSNSYCAGIVGYSSRSSVTNCWVKSNVCIGGRNHVGGISGHFSGNTLSGCRSEATLTAYSSTSNHFGGISGSLDALGNVKHCIVDGATIPSVSSYYGAIVGWFWSGTLTNNYYTNCSVAGVADATNVGCNEDDKLADYDGARHAVSISAASNAVITPAGTAIAYNVSGITAYDGNNVISCEGKLYGGATEQVNLSAYYSTSYQDYVFNGFTDGHGNALTRNDNGTYTLAMTTAAAIVTPDLTVYWGAADGADGTQAHPYLISSVAELNLLAEKVNAGKSFLGKYFRLMADIEYDSSVENNFMPIGFGGDAEFSGYFDGNGYCVSGLNVNMSGESYIGLFGNASNASISNLVLSGCSFNGSNYVGGIVGNMTSGTLSNCLVLETTVTCSRTCGLIAGYSDGTLSNNYYDAHSFLNGSSGIGNGVNSNNNDNATLGVRIIGADGVSITPTETVNGSYVNGTFKIYSSGLMYRNILYKKVLNTVTLSITYTGNIPQDHILEGFKAYGSMMSEAGGNYSVYLKGVSDCVIEPCIAIQYWTGTGTEDDPYLITSIAGMSHLAEEVNNGNTYENKHFALGKDLDYDRSVENNFEPIGNNPKFFKGNFDGRGHTISGVNVKRPAGDNDEVGIFGYVSGTSGNGNHRYIRNLTVVNSSFVSTNRDNAGGIIGYSYYTDVVNCHVGSDVYVSARYYAGGVSGHTFCSLLAGCTSGATVVGAGYNVGGITGSQCNEDIEDCLFYGHVSRADGNTGWMGSITGEIEYTDLSNNYYTTYGVPGVGAKAGYDTDGARFAIATKSKPSNIGSATKTYGTGSYTGITVYENALCYNGIYYWYDENLVVLGNEGAGNDELISANAYSTVNAKRNAVLADRTLYKDGSWNTICLPFAVDLTDEDSPLYRAVAKTLTDATVSGTTLTLSFGSEVTTLQAGVPYVIKWAEGDDIVNPVFTERQITASTPEDKSFTSEGSTVEFVGTYSPAALAPNTTSNLFLGSGNKLHYPTQEGYKVNACRAYFKISEAGAEQGAGSDAKAAFSTLILDFGDGDIEETATGITTTDCTDYTDSSAFGWYGIDGRPLSGKPTAKGIYIHGGKKVVVD